MFFLIAACFGSAFVVSIVTTRLMRTLSPRWGLIDQPAARKVHVTPTPLGGGIGIWAGVVVPIAMAQAVVYWLSGLEQLPEWLPEEILPHLGGVTFRSAKLWGILGAGTILSVMAASTFPGNATAFAVMASDE